MGDGREDCHMDQAQSYLLIVKNFQVPSLMGVYAVKERILNKTEESTRGIGKIIAW